MVLAPVDELLHNVVDDPLPGAGTGRVVSSRLLGNDLLLGAVDGDARIRTDAAFLTGKMFVVMFTAARRREVRPEMARRRHAGRGAGQRRRLQGTVIVLLTLLLAEKEPSHRRAGDGLHVDFLRELHFDEWPSKTPRPRQVL